MYEHIVVVTESSTSGYYFPIGRDNDTNEDGNDGRKGDADYHQDDHEINPNNEETSTVNNDDVANIFESTNPEDYNRVGDDINKNEKVDIGTTTSLFKEVRLGKKV